MKILIINIKQLVQVEYEPKSKVSGQEMSSVNCIEDAFLEIEDGLIKGFGSMNKIELNVNQYDRVINASERLVFPCFCDSHTHLVFAGSREDEFVNKIKGLSYKEIAAKGGGILNSAKKLHNTSKDELIESSVQKLQEIQSYGTGAVEIKSGYGLNTKDEIKMLEVIQNLKSKSKMTIKATFLGAHSIPDEYRDKQDTYVNLIINEMLPEVGKQKLADFIDIFCEEGFFSVNDTAKIIEAADKWGLRPKLHSNQLAFSGGVQVGVKYNALSVDHLEHSGINEINALKNTITMPALLPGAAFFLNMQYPPARLMIDNGLPLALASDYNPGSSPSGNMQFIMSLGCIKLKMLPEEVINAVTINAAYAMAVEKELGSICIGKKANIFITKKIPSYNYIPYSFGYNNIDEVII